MIYYIIYKSKRIKENNNQDIKDILNVSIKNNSKNEISGSLIHNGNTWIQYLEGPKKSLLNLFNKIKKDERHKNIELLDIGFRELRLFPEWSMLNSLGNDKFKIKGEPSASTVLRLQELFNEEFHFNIENIGITEEIELIKKNL